MGSADQTWRGEGGLCGLLGIFPMKKGCMMDTMMMSAKEWKEANHLAGLFQTIVKDCKSALPLYDEFLVKSGQLHSHLQSTTAVFSSFLDTLQHLSDFMTNTRGFSGELRNRLTDIIMLNREIESGIKTVTRLV